MSSWLSLLRAESTSQFSCLPRDVLDFCISPYLNWRVGSVMSRPFRSGVLHTPQLHRGLTSIKWALGGFFGSLFLFSSLAWFGAKTKMYLGPTIMLLSSGTHLVRFLLKIRRKARSGKKYLLMETGDFLTIYTSESQRNKIYSPNGQLVGRQIGKPKSHQPRLDGCKLQVSYPIVNVLDRTGQGIRSLNDSSLIAFDGYWMAEDQTIYLLDSARRLVRKYDSLPEGSVVNILLQAIPHPGTSQLKYLVVDAQGFLIMLQVYRLSKFTFSAVLVFDPQGHLLYRQKVNFLPTQLLVNSTGQILVFNGLTGEIETLN